MLAFPGLKHSFTALDRTHQGILLSSKNAALPSAVEPGEGGASVKRAGDQEFVKRSDQLVVANKQAHFQSHRQESHFYIVMLCVVNFSNSSSSRCQV